MSRLPSLPPEVTNRHLPWPAALLMTSSTDRTFVVAQAAAVPVSANALAVVAWAVIAEVAAQVVLAVVAGASGAAVFRKITSGSSAAEERGVAARSASALV